MLNLMVCVCVCFFREKKYTDPCISTSFPQTGDSFFCLHKQTISQYEFFFLVGFCVKILNDELYILNYTSLNAGKWG